MHSMGNITVHWMVINNVHHYLHRLQWILIPPNPHGSANTHPTPFVCTLRVFFPTQCKRMVSVPQIVIPKFRTWEPCYHKIPCSCNSHGGQRLSIVELCFLTPKTITKMWCAKITRSNAWTKEWSWGSPETKTITILWNFLKIYFNIWTLFSF